MPTSDRPVRDDSADERYYAGLPEITDFQDVMQLDRYAAAPASSLIVLTDVIGSTKAIEAGRYKDVNALGVSSIIAVCNAMRDIEIPFVFGGDGATLVVPGSRRHAAERALRGARAMARTAFDLGLRASIVPLTDLAAAGHVARVARLRVSENTRLAMFSGSAFSVAERWFKDPEIGARYSVSEAGDSDADFTGFECRWKPLRSRRGNTVSLIVRALAPSEAERTERYRHLLDQFDRIIDSGAYHPVNIRALKFAGLFGDYSVEARVRSGEANGPAYESVRRSSRRQAVIGQVLTATGMSAGGYDGRRYTRELVANSDFRKFDEMLRMVVDLKPAELARLKAHLDSEHHLGHLAYGMHVADAALITCIVRSYSGDHVHFIDGVDGGYALAAQNLKAQLSSWHRSLDHSE